MSINKNITSIGGLNRNTKLAVSKVKDYPKFTLYQVYRHIHNEYIPIYKTTLEPVDLKDYEVLK